MSTSPTKVKSPRRRSESPKKRPTKDDLLLETRMTANVVEQPTSQFYMLGCAISMLPLYLAVFLYEVSLTVTNAVLFAVVSAAVTYMLKQAYGLLFHCEFMKRDVPYSEIRSEKDANLLRSLRLELSMGRSLLQVNFVFVLLSSVLQLYVFKRQDPRANYLLAPSLGALVAWFVAYKSEETRKEKLRGPTY